MGYLKDIITGLVINIIDQGGIPKVISNSNLCRTWLYQVAKPNSNPTAIKAEQLLTSLNHPLAIVHKFFSKNLYATELDLAIHLLNISGIKMDLLEKADQENRVLLQHAIENSKSPKITPTSECITCNAQISQERANAVKTNLCIGCAELKEIKDRSTNKRPKF